MKFIDEHVKGDLAKGSTILQCVLSILDFECNKFHVQPEVLWARANSALVDVDGISDEEVMHICIKVNKQFQRKDKKPTAYQQDHQNTYVMCETLPLDQYIMLT